MFNFFERKRTDLEKQAITLTEKNNQLSIEIKERVEKLLDKIEKVERRVLKLEARMDGRQIAKEVVHNPPFPGWLPNEEVDSNNNKS